MKKKLIHNQKNSINKIFIDWTESSSKTTREKFEFSNIQMKQVCAYFFKFDFQLCSRKFYYDDSPYDNEKISDNPKTLRDYNFDCTSLENISVRNSYEKSWRFSDSNIVQTCPNCHGKGEYTCRKCNGKGKLSCPKCDAKGFLLCPKCKSSGKAGKIRCSKCGGYGYIERTRNGNRYREACPKCYKGWIDCSCLNSDYGPGKIRCEYCNGEKYITCSTCDGKKIETCSQCNGCKKIVNYVALNDSYKTIKNLDNHICFWHDSIPNDLKKLITGKTTEISESNKNIFLKSHLKDVPIVESEDSPNGVLNDLSKINAVKNQYSKLFNSVSAACEEKKGYMEGYSSFTTKKITKVRTEVFEINVIRLTYEYNSKSYDFWIYGNENSIFTLNSPFMEIAIKNEEKAKRFFSEKRYAKASNVYEKLCKISDENHNHNAFREYAKQLKISRKKAKVDYYMGLTIGLGFLLFAYFSHFIKFPFLEFNFSTDPLLSEIFPFYLSPNAFSFYKIALEVVFNILIPIFVVFVLFFKFIREHLNIKVLRLLCSAVIPVFYVFLIRILLLVLSSPIVKIIDVSIFVIFFILLFVIKISYQDYKMKNLEDSQKLKELKKEKLEEKKKKDEENGISSKKRWVALLLSFLIFGYFGIYRFYVGKFITGVFQVILATLDIFLLAGSNDRLAFGLILLIVILIRLLIDFVLILSGHYKDKKDLKLKNWI